MIAPMPAEVERLFLHWPSVPIVPRRRCACGRAYVLDGTPGQPCDLCRAEIHAEENRAPDCPLCEDRGWVWHRDAVCFANEMDAQIPCPVCEPDRRTVYD